MQGLSEYKNLIPKNLMKWVIVALVVVIGIFLILALVLVVLAFLFHDQIYDLLTKILNFIFGVSPDNFVKQFIQQAMDTYLKGLFKVGN